MRRRPFGILAVIVITAGRRRDFDNREGLLLIFIAPNCHSHFAAFDKFFDENFIIIRERLFDGRCQFFGFFHNIHADARPLGRSLDHYRQAKFRHNFSGQIAFLFKAVVSVALRRGNALTDENALGRCFIHRDSRSQYAGTGIGYTQHIESSLQQAVLTELAMQSIKDHLSAGFLDIHSKGLGIQLHAFGITALFLQSGQNSSARAPGNFGLRGRTAHYDNDFILIHDISQTPIICSTVLPILRRFCICRRLPW